MRDERDLAAVLARLAVDRDALIDRGENAAAVEFEIADDDRLFERSFETLGSLAPQDDTAIESVRDDMTLSFQIG